MQQPQSKNTCSISNCRVKDTDCKSSPTEYHEIASISRYQDCCGDGFVVEAAAVVVGRGVSQGQGFRKCNRSVRVWVGRHKA